MTEVGARKSRRADSRWYRRQAGEAERSCVRQPLLNYIPDSLRVKMTFVIAASYATSAQIAIEVEPANDAEFQTRESKQPMWIDAVFVGMILISVIGLAYLLIHG